MPTDNGNVAAGDRAKSAWPVFLAAHGALVRRIEEALAAAGLPELAWYDVLWTLEQTPDGRLRMSGLADAVVVARSNLTRLVDRLEHAGLVRRERVGEDRRGAYAVLTDEGRAMRSRMWAVYRPAIEAHFGSLLSTEENAKLREIMLRLLSAARLAGG